jgi:hypothetical protein
MAALVLEQGGALSVAVHVLLLWLRTRRGPVSIEVQRGKRRVKVTAQRVRPLDAAQLAELTREIAKTLDEE